MRYFDFMTIRNYRDLLKPGFEEFRALERFRSPPAR